MLRAFNKLKNGSDGTSKSKTNIKILKRSDERKARKNNVFERENAQNLYQERKRVLFKHMFMNQ